ncbi:MAG TPA: hypothetical protein VKZ63_19265 [Kofleriaceae bacterium]|nr:hypothetical protein [Kofleriaceae bacterium]
MRLTTSICLLALCLAAPLLGCERGGPSGALPPADRWEPPEPAPSRVGAAARRGARGGDPHAGLDMGGAGDPHAGLDMEMAGLEPPDPDRPIDQSKFLRGRIRAAGDAAGAPGLVKGAIVFLSAWPIDPATGESLGAPVAVDKLELGELPMEFQLDERHMMVKGTRFEGTVLLRAHVDGDGEARTREPGDVEGTVKATIPSTGIDLVLDTVLR